MIFRRIIYYCGIIIVYSIPTYSQLITYPVIDTGITEFYSNTAIINTPQTGQDYFGQDAHYIGNQPSYTDNEDGTITDNVTGLMWQKNMGEKISYADALIKADTMSLAGYSDWRFPDIKELYSLIQFTGIVSGQTAIEMFIDTEYFDQALGNTNIGEREIDAQTWSSTQYTSLTMNNDSTVFGVNFVDGRIKGYPKYQPANPNVPQTMFARMVRGNSLYGKNNFEDNGDGTITDIATGLMWQKADEGFSFDWKSALEYAEDCETGGYDDWRLPNAKELQSIVDYSRCPDKTNSPAINPIFQTTEINDPEGNPGQYPYFWTSTSHLDGSNPYSHAVYIAFGEAQGRMNGNLLDVHGAGAQRSDPKSGNPGDYPQYFGPQGDVRYVYNYVRCVRSVSSSGIDTGANNDFSVEIFPNPSSDIFKIKFNQSYPEIELLIFDNTGKKILNYDLFNISDFNLNISNLDAGLYLISARTNKHKSTARIVKL